MDLAIFGGDPDFMAASTTMVKVCMLGVCFNCSLQHIHFRVDITTTVRVIYAES